MKLNNIIMKCLNDGNEKIASCFTTYTYSENDISHKLTIYTKNYGKHVLNEANYSKIVNDCVVYEWNGKKSDFPKL